MQKCIPKIYFIPLKVWRVFDFILALLEIMQYNLFSVKSYSRKFSWKLSVIVLTCQCLHEKHKYIGYHRACRQVEPIIFSITFRWLVFAKPCSNLCIPKRFVGDLRARDPHVLFKLTHQQSCALCSTASPSSHGRAAAALSNHTETEVQKMSLQFNHFEIPKKWGTI